MPKKQPKTIIAELLNQELYSGEKATFITEWAGSYYFLIMRDRQPLGIVQFFLREYYGKLVLSRYNPLEGNVSKRIIDAFDKVATTFNNSVGVK